MEIPTRESVKVILLNRDHELLLMHVSDPTTTAEDGKYNGDFWIPIGGGIEEGETREQAALREVYEETGITLKESDLGPFVWFGECDLIISGKLTRIKQIFAVAKTEETTITLSGLTDEEKKVVQKLAWFSLEDLRKSTEIIYPIDLADYLSPILEGKYPQKPIYIDLAKKPPRNS